MAKAASEWFFEACGLTKWGREPDFVAPKPLNKRQRDQLGGALDQVDRELSAVWAADTGRFSLTPDSVSNERFSALCHRRHVAKIAFIEALNAHALFLRCKAENSSRVPSNDDGIALRDAMYAAQDRFDDIEAADPDFITTREYYEARTAAILASDLYDIAQTKFQDAQREARADKTKGIVRHRASRVRRERAPIA